MTQEPKPKCDGASMSAPVVTQADREAAVSVLMPRLTAFKDWQSVKRDGLKGRIARIKAHMGDDLPEVQAAMIARTAAEVASAANVAELVEALEFYANPKIYEPHPHAPAFDRRDLSYHAIAALAKAKGEQP